MAASINISLPEPLKAYLDAQVEARYGTPSDYVQELIESDRERRRSSLDRELDVLEERLVQSLSNQEGSLELTAEQVRRGGVVAMIREHQASKR